MRKAAARQGICVGAAPAVLCQGVSSRVRLHLGLDYVACLEVALSVPLLFSSLGE